MGDSMSAFGESGGALPQFADEALLEALRDAVRDVFETMVFTACEPAAMDESALDPTRFVERLAIDAGDGVYREVPFTLNAHVGIAGQPNGRVLLRCCAQGATDVARGLLMLDEDEAIDAAEAADALGECANMVAGVVKTKMFDPDGKFELSCPEINSHPDLAGKFRAGALAYKLGRGIIVVEIWLDAEL